MDYKNMIPLHTLFERFLKLEKVDNVADINNLLLMLNNDPVLKDKFDKFCKELTANFKKKQK